MPAIPAVRCAAACQGRSRAGFTLFEAVMVLIIVATVVGALTPSVARQLTRARVNRAANVVAADFFLAQSLAGRQRAPIVVTFSTASKTMTFADGPTGTVLLVRRFGEESEFKLQEFSATPASMQVLPNGMANTSVTVTVFGAGLERIIRMTRAGQVRIVQ